VGVSPNLDISEIPDEAFNPAFGDDKATSSALKKRNKRERGGSHADKAGQLGFRFEVTHMTSMDNLARWLAERAEQVDAMPEDDSTQVQAKAKAFDDYHATSEYLKNRFELDLWTAAFFWNIPKADGETMLAPTQQELIQLRNGGELDSRLVEGVKEISKRLNFFHWKLAFPKVFAGENSGFDCVLGNPPWEMMQLDPQEFFAVSAPHIANALNMSVKEKLINQLAKDNIELFVAYNQSLHDMESQQKFVHESRSFPLTSFGRINLMALFAELGLALLSPNGYSGLIIPTGIATDSFNQYFFQNIIQNQRLNKLIGFENEDFIFPGIANVVRFCVFVTCGVLVKQPKPKFAFYLRRFEQLTETERFFELSIDELQLLNPNTVTCPTFRNRTDAEINKLIYARVPILLNEKTDDNLWGFKGLLMFMLNTDSKLFSTEPKENYLPLYEGKLIWHFDHRFSSYEHKGLLQGKGGRGLPEMPLELHQDPNYSIQTQYWISKEEVDKAIPSTWDKKWLFGFRDITSAKLERTAVFTILPYIGAGNSLPIFFIDKDTVSLAPCLLGCLNSLVFDYVTRQKIAGTHMNFFFVKQLPVLPPSAYTPADIDFIAPRVLELVYTANDLRPFAEDMGYHGEPFRWDEVRRAQLRAELDAYYARLYGLTRDELRYILDPKEVHGEDFPGETFRVLKEKEIRLYGEYRTRRLVLEAWDKMNQE